MQGRDDRPAGPLRVSAMELVLRGLRADFGSFVAAHPGVSLTVTATDDEVSLTRREADVVLRLNNAPPEHLVGRRLGAMQFDVYAARRCRRGWGSTRRWGRTRGSTGTSAWR